MSPSSGDALLCFVKRTLPAGSKGTNWYRQDYTQHKVVVPGASRCLAKVAHQTGGYRLRKSKLQMANELQAKHPDWPLITCRRRIDTWLSLAESILYAPVCDAFGTNSDRFKLQSEQESA